MSTSYPAALSSIARVPLWQDLLPSALLALAAAWAVASGLDQRLADAVFDAAAQGFPARASLALELLGHRLAKSAVLLVWLGLAAAALASTWLPRLARHRSLLWTTVVAMAAGPAIVVILKGMTTHPCPWDLKRYGGLADLTHRWFVGAAQAGRCFPSGHAAGGFSLVALYFAARALGQTRRARGLLALAIGVGGMFAAVRMVQGAHFLSHNLWAAALDWLAAAAVFRAAPFVAAGWQQPAPAARPAGKWRPATAAAPEAHASALPAKRQPAGWRRLGPAARYALAGLRSVWQREAAFRQEAVAAALLVPVALVADVTRLERAALVGALLAVLVVEVLNSAIEAVVDLASPQRHALAAAAKDAGAAAVMLALAAAGATWLLVLWPWR